MKKIEKGTPGYLDYAHKVKLMVVSILAAVIILLLIISMFLSDFGSGICKIAAILLVLPASNFGVTYIAMFPYHSRGRETYDILCEKAKGKRVLAELAITNPKGPTVSIPYAVIAPDRVLCYYERIGKKDKLSKMPSALELSSYLEGRLRLSEVDMPVEVLTDESRFMKLAPGLRSLKTEEELVLAQRAASALLANSF